MSWDAIKTRRAELSRPLVMAHRGNSALLPENSPSAFDQAIADGADIIETDLHFTKDDHIVLIHDDTLERTVNGTGAVGDYTLAELKSFTLKQPAHRQDVTEHILTLAELIERTEANLPLGLELKDTKFSQAEYAQKLVAVLAKYDMLTQCGIISFDLPRVLAVLAQSSELVGGWITLKNPSPNQPVLLLGPFWPLLYLNPTYLRRAKRLGKIVCPLDPTPEPRLKRYLKWDVDILITNNPATTLEEIKRLKTLERQSR